MKWSEFIYLCAKEGADYGDPTMTYESFLMQGMDATDDYKGFLDKAFTACNQYLQRISTLGYVPMKIAEYEALGFSATKIDLPEDCKAPKYVFQYRDDNNHQLGYETVPFRKNGNELLLTGAFSPYRKVYVQYQVRIDFIRRAQVPFIETSQDENGIEIYIVEGNGYTVFSDAFNACEALQIDLKDEYGIEDDVMSVGIDWVKGRLNENDSKGHSQEVEAESRLQGMEPDQYEYAQIGTRRVLL